MAPPWCRGDSSALSPFHMGQEAAPGSPIAKQVQGAAGSRGPTANVAQPPDLLLTFSGGASSEGRAVCTPVTIPPGQRGYDPAENLPAPGPLPARRPALAGSCRETHYRAGQGGHGAPLGTPEGWAVPGPRRRQAQRPATVSCGGPRRLGPGAGRPRAVRWRLRSEARRQPLFYFNFFLKNPYFSITFCAHGNSP